MLKHVEILSLLRLDVQVPTQGRPGKRQLSVWQKPPACRALAGAGKCGEHPCAAQGFGGLLIIHLNIAPT